MLIETRRGQHSVSNIVNTTKWRLLWFCLCIWSAASTLAKLQWTPMVARSTASLNSACLFLHHQTSLWLSLT